MSNSRCTAHNCHTCREDIRRIREVDPFIFLVILTGAVIGLCVGLYIGA